jgi:hypothetical protein
MKKIIMAIFVVLFLLTLTNLSQAAEKTLTKYVSAGLGIDVPAGSYIPVIPGMGEPVVTSGDHGAVTSDGTVVTLGGGDTCGAGSIWYQGNNVAAGCANGVCNFGTGLRAFFKFRFHDTDSTNGSTNSGDGFTFAILNATENTSDAGIPDRTGGQMPNLGCMGELLGYAGTGNTNTLQKNKAMGLVPPKMAIEFDIFPNRDGDICWTGSRNDYSGQLLPPSDFRNHIALMYWGRNDYGNDKCQAIYFKNSYDDNRHGEGNNSSYGTLPSSGYYGGPFRKNANGYNWLEDNQLHSVRVEIIRTTAGAYTTKVWVDCNGSTCVDAAIPLQATDFQDVLNAFTDKSPQIDRTDTFTADEHQKMNTIIFGLTEGTGGTSQTIQVSDMRVYFTQTSAKCTGGDIVGTSTSGGITTMTHTFTSTVGSPLLTCNTAVAAAKVEVIGGGGGGGRRTNLGGTGGGGGGAYASSSIPLAIGSHSLHVGAGGTGGSAGGDSWFETATTVMAKGGFSVVGNNTLGGAAGGHADDSFGSTTFKGGNGGTGSAAVFGNYSGGGGGGAGRTNVGGNASTSTAGTGNAPGGNGGAGRTGLDYGDGNAGNAAGGGGGGAHSLAGVTTGGSGASGVVIISYPE